MAQILVGARWTLGPRHLDVFLDKLDQAGLLQRILEANKTNPKFFKNLSFTSPDCLLLLRALFLKIQSYYSFVLVVMKIRSSTLQ